MQRRASVRDLLLCLAHDATETAAAPHWAQNPYRGVYSATPHEGLHICPSPGAVGSAAKGAEFWGFWCAIGFVAGFNERWAFGVLGRDSAGRTGKAS